MIDRAIELGNLSLWDEMLADNHPEWRIGSQLRALAEDCSIFGIAPEDAVRMRSLIKRAEELVKERWIEVADD